MQIEAKFSHFYFKQILQLIPESIRPERRKGFKAYRFVEEKVREKAQLEAKDIGLDLMNKAFKPSSGKLIVTTCAVPAEQEGVQSLFRGAISFFKNPSSHRTVDYKDRQIAIQVIAFAELLSDILSKTELRR